MKRKSSSSTTAVKWPAYLQRDAQNLYNQLWGAGFHAKHFIAPTPVSMERHHLGELEESHVVSEKNDGERALLLLGREKKSGDPYTVFVMRNRELKHVDATAEDDVKQSLFIGMKDPKPVHIHDGTLLDGELMKNGTFVVFDAVVVGGYDMKTQPSYALRMRAARDVVSYFTFPFRVLVKTFYAVSEIYKALSESKGDQDGLIFMPKSEVIRTGRQESMIKWKPKEKCTIDLQWTGTEFVCVGQNGGTEVPPLDAPIPDDSLVTGGIYECSPPDSDGDPWVVGHHRKDKVAANHIVTVRRTIRTIQDDIQLDEIQ
ncbi:MAG: hypothetical protein CMD33_03940 [Flavobacteriales bacterium]|mgnify:CR=1 FL=1|nr:hypothetical protein [Flavobacteriales bacterium]